MPQFFWKYLGMEEHWKRAHSSITMPENLATLLEITDKEREELKKFDKAKNPGKAKKRKRKERQRDLERTAQEERTKRCAEDWAKARAEAVPEPAGGTTDAL